MKRFSSGFAKSRYPSHQDRSFFIISYLLPCPFSFVRCIPPFLYLSLFLSRLVYAHCILVLVSPPREYVQHHSLSLLLALNLLCTCTHTQGGIPRPPPPALTDPPPFPVLVSLLCLLNAIPPCSCLTFTLAIRVRSLSLSSRTFSPRVPSYLPPGSSPSPSRPHLATRPRVTWLCGCTWHVVAHSTHSDAHRATNRHGIGAPTDAEYLRS